MLPERLGAKGIISDRSVQNALSPSTAENGKIAFMKPDHYSGHGAVRQGGPAGPQIAPTRFSNANFVNTVRKGKKDDNQSEYCDGTSAFSANFVSDSELSDI